VTEKTESEPTVTGKDRRMARMGITVIRTQVGKVFWLVCVVFAVVLAAGALLISLHGAGTNSTNSLYEWIVNAGDKLDFGVLSRENGLFDFVGKNSDTKDALANWGLAAIVWLVIGRIADRIIRH
jgi:hypothetical protein